jgi:pimeloyl-ACP methyl ester carboxylesterase
MELELEGAKVYAATGGTPFDARKPAMLFIHGAGQDHTGWQLPARYFAWHGHGALALDLPGHGRSEGPALATIGAAASWLARVMDAVGIGKAGQPSPSKPRRHCKAASRDWRCSAAGFPCRSMTPC